MKNVSDFHYKITGNPKGKWLIFLHGLLGSGHNWMKITPAFEEEFHILVFDQRGHGKSFKPAHGYAPEDFAGDVEFLMDSLKISKASLIGHSMGGRNAFCFAAENPLRVERLVIEDIGPQKSVDTGRRLVNRVESIPVPFGTKRAAKEYLLGEFGDPPTGNLLYNHVIGLSDGGYGWDFSMSFLREVLEKGRESSYWEQLEGLRCPTLVIRGERSSELGREEFEKMLRVQKNLKGVEVSGAGHVVHFDRPREFIKILKDFLD